MDTIILKYLDSSGVVHTATVDVLSVRGFDDPDDIKFVPEKLFEYADRSSETMFVGFSRIITFVVVAVADSTTDKYLAWWFAANSRSVTYQGESTVAEEVFVVPEDSKNFRAVWLDDFSLAKEFTFKVVENVIRATWPDAIPVITTDIMYIAKKIQINPAATDASPEVFTTNSGKLLYNYGTTPFPPMSTLSNIVSVDVDGSRYMDCTVHRVGDITQVGNNISFIVALSGAGNPASDGNYYADFIFMLQPIT